MASKTFYEFQPLDKKGNPYPLSTLKGTVVLVVNTASKCSFTPQYRELEQLYQQINSEYPNKFVVLGFPCNQFANQDPGTNDEIQTFCQVNYGVSFPVLGKVDVNGPNAEPLWSWMKEKQPGIFGLTRIKWNFEKFLITADGQVAGRWWSMVKPQSLYDTIVREIEAGRN
ncbi:glutathione peroxidase [Aspergillus sclerotialis]|uniref:Glutathione peroxidase n=1 Tax=Aspergillus sclerotialis TaxID=2070753 RepID=A0A3A2ZYM1_9EURO|nr:glutathione peroxidase [Aspergillus sclerotialis]